MHIETKTEKKPSHRKYIIAVGFILLLITSALVFVLHTQESQSDPVSEKIIREVAAAQLGKDPNELNDEDFAKIIDLRISSKELKDIKLLDKFTNLQTLDLTNCRAAKRIVPKLMTILEKIGLHDTSQLKYIDLRPLRNLRNLKSLTLLSTDFNNIKPLANLINLRELYLGSDQVEEIDSLRQLINLETLVISATNVSNLEPIEGITNLRKLDIIFANVSSLEPIAKLTNLQELTLGGKSIQEIEPLKALNNLKVLVLFGCYNLKKEQIDSLQQALPNLKIQKIDLGKIKFP